MHILTVSLNYRRTPVELRERFSLSADELAQALERLQQTKSILESVLLSTCNRTELFALVDQRRRGRDFCIRFFSEWFGLEIESFSPFLEIKEDDEAIKHLFRLAVGLDSMVLGETQILGQVKEAFFAAQEAGNTGTIFNTLFKQVITLAKRAHSETKIGRHAVSVGYAAVELSRKIHGQLKGKKAVIIGAGKMSELVGKHLAHQHLGQLMVLNRTYDRAVELADQIGGQALPLEQLFEALSQADILISSTGAKEYVLSRHEVAQVMERRPARPLFMIDIAVPRDLDPEINQVENVFLYDIDDLNGIVDANLQERQEEAEKVEMMITGEIEEFKDWVATLGVVPLITALRQKAMGIQEETMRKIINKLPGLSEEEQRVIRKQTKSMINQLMHDPIVRLKELAVKRRAREALDLFAHVFALEGELEKQAQVEQAAALVRNLEKKESASAHASQAEEIPLHL